MKNYILYSSLLCIFCERFVIHGLIPFDLRFYYFIYIINLLIIGLSKVALRIKIGHLIVYVVFVLSSLYGLIRGTNTLGSLLFQVIGIFFCSLYYYNFYRALDFDIKRIFRLYVDMSVFFASLGIFAFIVILPFVPNIVHTVESTMSEPAVYSYTVIPAMYYCIQVSLKEKKGYWRTFIILLSLLLSGSSIGYLGLILCVVFLIKKISFTKAIVAISVAAILISGIYVVSEKFRVRIDDSVKVITTKNLAEANLSTYALLSNAFVAIESFKESPIIGNGLGSHPTSHDRFVGNIDGVDEFEQYMQLNSKDASSLFLRLTSELGLMGICCAFFFIIRFYPSSKFEIEKFPELHVIQKAALIYFLLKLLRAGHYFSPEFYFFLFIYYLAYVVIKEDMHKLQTNG